MRHILEIAHLSIKLAYGPTLFIFTAISALFVLFSLLYFFIPELAQFGSRLPGQNAALAGLSSINIFLIFLSIFLSLSVLMRQFQRDNLIFFLSKPLKPTQLLLGTTIGLAIVLLGYWALLSLELLVIIGIFSNNFLLQTLFALLPLAFLAIIYTCLCVFFFSLWPSFLSAIFPFLFILTSLARVDIKALLSSSNLWLKRMVDLAFLFIPPIGQVMAISLKKLNFINVEQNSGLVLLHCVFIIIFFLTLGCLRISKKFSRL